jgi:hypothetical protein
MEVVCSYKHGDDSVYINQQEAQISVVKTFNFL